MNTPSLKGALIFSHFPFRGLRGKSGWNQLITFLGRTLSYNSFLRNQDFVRHCEATPEVNVTSCEGFKQLYRETAKTFPDQRMNIEVMVAEGDRVAFWGTFSGTRKGPMGPFPATGRSNIYWLLKESIWSSPIRDACQWKKKQKNTGGPLSAFVFPLLQGFVLPAMTLSLFHQVPWGLQYGLEKF